MRYIRTARFLHNGGFTMLEILVYLGILAVSSTIILVTVVGMLRPTDRLKSVQAISSIGLETLDRMTRELRNGYDIDGTASTFGVSPGRVTARVMVAGVQETRSLYLQGGVLMLDDNGVIRELSSDAVSVTSLTFYQASTTVSKGVRIQMTLGTTTVSGSKSETFYTTVMMRDSYN